MKKLKCEKLLFKTLFFVSTFGISSVAQAVEVKFSGYAKLDAIYDVDQPQGDLSFANQLATGDATNSQNASISNACT